MSEEPRQVSKEELGKILYDYIKDDKYYVLVSPVFEYNVNELKNMAEQITGNKRFLKILTDKGGSGVVFAFERSEHNDKVITKYVSKEIPHGQKLIVYEPILADERDRELCNAFTDYVQTAIKSVRRTEG